MVPLVGFYLYSTQMEIKKIRMLFLYFAIIAGLSVLFLIIGVYNNLSSPRNFGGDKIIEIPIGSSLNTVANILEENGILSHKATFVWPARFKGLSSGIRAGEFLILTGSSLNDILTILTNGKNVQYPITFPEGLSSSQIVKLIVDEPKLEGPIRPIPIEGSLLPDTYNFTKGENRSKLISRMQLNMSLLLNDLWEERPDDFILKSKGEVITLASIIEKETALSIERPLIASVFLNRLDKNMRLQSDPTVIYGITQGEPLGRSISQSDLDGETPYNTYKIRGLPSGPISNPGKAAIEAVFNPGDTIDLYFVADGTGGHVFSETLAEHNKNVLRWRKIEQGSKQ